MANGQSALHHFRFDTNDVDWKDFIIAGWYYKLLDVNVGARTADMIVKCDSGARCMYHLHVTEPQKGHYHSRLCQGLSVLGALGNLRVP